MRWRDTGNYDVLCRIPGGIVDVVQQTARKMMLAVVYMHQERHNKEWLNHARVARREECRTRGNKFIARDLDDVIRHGL